MKKTNSLPVFQQCRGNLSPSNVSNRRKSNDRNQRYCYERIALGMSVDSERWDLVLVRSAGKERLDLVLVRSAGSDVRCCGNIKEKTVVTAICTLVSNAIISINLCPIPHWALQPGHDLKT